MLEKVKPRCQCGQELERGSVSTYLKLELLSHRNLEQLERFHLFEAGAFVTAAR